MPKTIAFMNHKGGVAKTTSSVSLAHAMPGKTLLIDLDPQSHASYSLGLKDIGESNSTAVLFQNKNSDINDIIVKYSDDIDVAPSSLFLESAIASVYQKARYEYFIKKQIDKTEYDFVIIDCPPSLGATTINAIIAADLIVTPVCSDGLSPLGIPNLMALMEDYEIETPVKLLWTIYNSGHTKQNNHLKKTVAKMDMFKVKISQSALLKNAVHACKPIGEFLPNSKPNYQYKRLAMEINNDN